MISPIDILHGKILIVDDQEVNILILERMLSGAGYLSVTSTMNSSEVCRLHFKNHYDLILLDLQMPIMDGFQVLEELKKLEIEDYLPVLVITAQPDHKLRALQAGAKDFISKPIELADVLARVRNMLEVRLLHTELRNYNNALEKRVLERTADLQQSNLETILTMTRAMEYKDEETGIHVNRISFYCHELAQMLGLDNEFIDQITIASPMHDIGKIGIPDHILLKPGKLTADEWKIMREHTIIGANILGNSKSLYLKMASEIALNHHERWDGGGYPNGKQGEDIPLAAKIMNICDIYDALRSIRPYKTAFDHQKTVDMIVCGDNQIHPGHFDPFILSAFKKNHQAFQDIFETYTS